MGILSRILANRPQPAEAPPKAPTKKGAKSTAKPKAAKAKEPKESRVNSSRAQFIDVKPRIVLKPAGKRPPVADKDFQIVIPTYRRPHRQITLLELPPEIRANTLVLTSDWDEAKEIRRYYKHDLVWAVDDPSVDGIAKKRQWIIENVRSENIFQMDDDMYFFRRCPMSMREWHGTEKSGQWRVTDEAMEKGVTFLFKDGFDDKQRTAAWKALRKLMVEDGYAHTCISSRMMNNAVRKELKIVGRAMHAIGHHRRTLLDNGIRFDEVRFREDFNVTLHLLKLGYPNAIMQNLVINPLDFGAEGGVSTERTMEASNAEAFRLAKIHPGLVRVQDRKYSTSEVRQEVVVSWTKAYTGDDYRTNQ